MKKFLLIALFCGALFGSGASVKDEEVERNWKSAQAAYNATCAYCHRDTNVGVDTVNIPYPADVLEDRVKVIENVVRHGLNAMPPFRETEIDNVTLRQMAERLAKGEME